MSYFAPGNERKINKAVAVVLSVTNVAAEALCYMPSRPVRRLHSMPVGLYHNVFNRRNNNKTKIRIANAVHSIRFEFHFFATFRDNEGVKLQLLAFGCS